MQDGPMYGHSFADPDGHAWEVLHMDVGGDLGGDLGGVDETALV
jgi:hypothetical protein